MDKIIDEDTLRLRSIYDEALPGLLERCSKIAGTGKRYVIVTLKGVEDFLWGDYEDALTNAYKNHFPERFFVMPVRPAFITERVSRDIF